jgi:hypothetical protein
MPRFAQLPLAGPVLATSKQHKRMHIKVWVKPLVLCASGGALPSLLTVRHSTRAQR